MNRNDDILNFLVEGLIAPQRDLVTRAFYKFAEGDPNSAPVNEAILLTACARRVSQAPQELREAMVEFRKLLDRGRLLETNLHERVEASNANVVASFKDEATRATSYLRASSQKNEEIVSEGRRIADLMRKSNTQGELLLSELREIKTELKLNRESNQKTAEATENNKTISLSIKEIVTHLADASAIHWITIGVVVGAILAGSAILFPWWVPSLLLALAVGLLQAMARSSWKFVREKAATIKTVD